MEATASQGTSKSLNPLELSSLTQLINRIPADTDILDELRTALLESLNMNETAALKHLRIRLEPAVLVNDEVAPKKKINRTILKILNAFGIPSEEKEGVSIVITTIDKLFEPGTFPIPNARAKKLYESHENGRSSEVHKWNRGRVSSQVHLHKMLARPRLPLKPMVEMAAAIVLILFQSDWRTLLTPSRTLHTDSPVTLTAP